MELVSSSGSFWRQQVNRFPGRTWTRSCCWLSIGPQWRVCSPTAWVFATQGPQPRTEKLHRGKTRAVTGDPLHPGCLFDPLPSGECLRLSAGAWPKTGISDIRGSESLPLSGQAWFWASSSFTPTHRQSLLDNSGQLEDELAERQGSQGAEGDSANSEQAAFRLHLARYSSRNPRIRKTTSQNEQQATGKPLFHWRNDDFKRGEETSGCLCSSGLLYTKQSSCSRLHLHFRRKTENSMGL
ncbi:uncharacterized protein LOC113015245 [Astatotilapia calliptera]|uniref:uncharacterized protein LOC113015232 n=1 Tax=Astatotilapia calliptera TaxID=8154 RepID=UPI000E410B2C|nr:uncharacterized protein LOC113015232 [Astatotilapia calliptera]XP_026012980.1 uncharacterized protein LOC113015245 [Astatotilapia calliptera]